MTRTASAALLAFALVAGVALAGQQAVRVLVRTAGEVVELDEASFAATRRTPLPKEVGGAAGELAANRLGQLLLRAPGSGRPFWFFDGTVGRFVEPPAASGARCALSSDGRSLFWFEQESRVTNGAGVRADAVPSIATTFRAWQTDLAGGARSPVASFALGPCRCETLACEETCAEPLAWVPERGIDDFFIVSRWIPGQLGPTYQSTAVYRRTASAWTEVELPRPLETVLDAADGGRTIVHAVNDTGCCGWMNESGDLTLLLRDGKDVRLFDEREEYANDTYDVSFHTPDAKLSPSRRLVALTVVSTARRGEEPRPSLDAAGDPPELARVRRAIDELPAVLVVEVGAAAPRRVARIDHATLVGWLDDARLLLRRDDRTFEVWDVKAARGAKVPIPGGAQVLVR